VKYGHVDCEYMRANRQTDRQTDRETAGHTDRRADRNTPLVSRTWSNTGRSVRHKPVVVVVVDVVVVFDTTTTNTGRSMNLDY